MSRRRVIKKTVSRRIVRRRSVRLQYFEAVRRVLSSTDVFAIRDANAEGRRLRSTVENLFGRRAALIFAAALRRASA